MGNYQVLEQSHLAIEVNIPEHPIWVIGDDSAIERIFLNLLQNASRYAYSFLSISIKEEEEKVSISFINDTNMLSEDDIPHLFDRFYMQDSSRNQGGTGLGLTVAKSLAEEMGGILEVSIVDKETLNSQKDKFTICFELCVKATKK
jgi:signal transduction histidine kinase